MSALWTLFPALAPILYPADSIRRTEKVQPYYLVVPRFAKVSTWAPQSQDIIRIDISAGGSIQSADVTTMGPIPVQKFLQLVSGHFLVIWPKASLFNGLLYL